MPSIPSSVKIVYGDFRELILDQFNIVRYQYNMDHLNKTHPGVFIFRKLNVLPCTVVDGKIKPL